MLFWIFLFLNIFLFALAVFLCWKIKTLKNTQKEMEMVLKIRSKAKTRALEELAEDLEGQMEKRTEELQTKIKELERFQKMVVGRELKMIELKKEIEELKNFERIGVENKP